MQRKLSHMEQTMAFANHYFPYNVVSVIKYRGTLDITHLETALTHLSTAYPLLHAHINKKSTTLFLDSNKATTIPIQVVQPTANKTWLKLANQWLNSSIDAQQGHHLQLIIVEDTASGEGQLIVAANHTLLDSEVLNSILHDLLTLYAQVAANQISTPEPSTLQLRTEDAAPPKYKGWRYVSKYMWEFMYAMYEEVQFLAHPRAKIDFSTRKPFRNQILTISLSEAETQALIRKTRQQRVSVNETLHAALFLAVNKHRYGNQRHLLRTLIPVSLRKHLQPQIATNTIGSYIVTLRLRVMVDPHVGLWTLAKRIQEQLLVKMKRNDKYFVAWLGKLATELSLRVRLWRLAHIAISYTGTTAIENIYGDLGISGLHAFYSGNVIGPEVYIRSGIFQRQLVLDVMSLDADMTLQTAQAIADDMVALLITNSTPS